jgi:IS4 transposase
LPIKPIYNGFQINTRYRKRWTIELHFKYYKQYLQLGKEQCGRLGAIQSQLYCVALAGLIVALFRHQLSPKVSFRVATKQITSFIYDG